MEREKSCFCEIKVSVVIPVYNVEKYLQDCLDSVINQSLKEIQIICVNDGSTDDSPVILEEYRKKDTRIKIIHQENQGQSQARNNGMKYVQGKYLYFLDSDDWLELQALETLYQVAEAKDLDMLFFSSALDYEDGSPDMGDYHRETSTGQEVWTGLEIFRYFMDRDEFYPMAVVHFYKTDFILSNYLVFIPNVLYEDGLFSFESVLKAQRAYCIKDIFYHYRIRTNSTMHSQWFFKHVEYSLIIWMECILAIKRNQVDAEFLPYVRKFVSQVKVLVLTAYEKVYHKDQTLVGELLSNFERLLFDEPMISVKEANPICNNRENYPELCFFGGGNEAVRALHFFKDYHLAFPLAICDSSPQKQGTKIEGVPVISFEEAVKRYKNLSIIITSVKFYQEIKEKVVAVLGEDRVIYFEI